MYLHMHHVLPNNDSPLNQQAAELWDNQSSTFLAIDTRKHATYSLLIGINEHGKRLHRSIFGSSVSQLLFNVLYPWLCPALTCISCCVCLDLCCVCLDLCCVSRGRSCCCCFVICCLCSYCLLLVLVLTVLALFCMLTPVRALSCVCVCNNVWVYQRFKKQINFAFKKMCRKLHVKKLILKKYFRNKKTINNYFS